MSILSIRDLYKEIGKNIFIHPLKIDNIKANTINLTVSEFAWSLKTKKNIHENAKVTIEPNDTALIYTNEAVYVTKKIGGTYHSKVSLVSKGLGHIGTTLDPEYLGLSLIAIHNHSGEEVELDVGDTFVSLMFHYLKTPTYAVSHNNVPGQTTILQNFSDLDGFKEWSNKNDWINEQRKLKKKMHDSTEYVEMKEYLKALKSEEQKLLLLLFDNKITKYIVLGITFLILSVIVNYFNNTYNLSFTNEHYLVMLTLFVAIIISDIGSHFK
jgi:deoxycytidine triphosphate deaminase